MKKLFAVLVLTITALFAISINSAASVSVKLSAEYIPEAKYDLFGTFLQYPCYGGTLNISLADKYSFNARYQMGIMDNLLTDENIFQLATFGYTLYNDPQYKFDLTAGYIYDSYTNIATFTTFTASGYGIGFDMFFNPSSTQFNLTTSLFTTLFTECERNGVIEDLKEITALKAGFIYNFTSHFSFGVGYNSVEFVLGMERAIRSGFYAGVGLKI